MKYVDEFRDPEKAQALARSIRAVAAQIDRARPLQIMEVCGGHTHAIFRYGITQFLPDSVEFVHGPGCPVCVLPRGRVDDAVALAERPEVIFASFGDAIRVPGTKKSLLQARADGADLRIVYSPLDALALARANPARQVIFFGIGFETTMPATALTVIQARAEKLANFSLFCNHVTIVPTLKAILDSPDVALDGLLGPGHVSMVIGSRPYEFIASDYRLPIVIAGFEPLDVLQALSMVLTQIAEGRCAVNNQYRRAVTHLGNARALAAIDAVFEPREFFEWRGLGSIAQSGVRLRAAYADFDAERRFALPRQKLADPKLGEPCQCGDVLKGKLKPPQCRLFGAACTPQTPLGALMVSSEGACAAHYTYGRMATRETH